MNQISKILLPFDFQDSAQNALDYAIAFSKEGRHTEIRLIYVSTPGDSLSAEEVESKFEDVLTNVRSKPVLLSVSSQIRSGEINSEILAAKAEFNADLILMGTEGGSSDDEGVDTHTSSLISDADCPVIVVPKTFDTFELEHITLAIEKSKLSKPDLLTILLVIARRFNAKIHVLTVYDEHDEDYLKDQDNESTLTYYFEKYYETNSAARSSRIADSIMEYDKKRSIDMLAIIPRNHDTDGTPSEGKLTQYLSKHSDIPILIID